MSTAGLGTPTVLLIDYDPRSIARLRSLLTTAGYRTIIAHDGLAGIESFENDPPDLTLVQDLLPKKHGFEVCRQLKETEHGQRSAVLVLTSVRGSRAGELRQCKCDGFLRKPFEDEELLERVRAFLPILEPGRGAAAVEAQPGEQRPVAPPAPPAPRPTTPSPPYDVEFGADDIVSRLETIMPSAPVQVRAETPRPPAATAAETRPATAGPTAPARKQARSTTAGTKKAKKKTASRARARKAGGKSVAKKRGRAQPAGASSSR